MSDQAENLRRKIEALQRNHQAKTIAIISGKGGVGKSNFALNFSIALSRRNKKVLLFDLDIGMGNIDILLGRTSKYSIVNMFDNHLSIYDIIESEVSNFSYIAGGSGLTDIFLMDESKFEYFTTEFSKLLDSFDYIIFDLGAGISHGSAYYMLAADECFVITTPEPTSLTDAYAMIKHLTNKNRYLPLYLLVNRATSQKDGLYTINKLQQVVRKFLDRNLLSLGILPDDKAVMRAVTSQTPFILDKPKSQVSVALNVIVNQYLEKKTNNHNPKKIPFSFVKKLKQLLAER